MTAPSASKGFDWENAGRELGEKLGAYHAIVVIGLDPVVTGRVAVGIARAQAAHRRVAVGDLFAESQPIQDLVHGDDPHGIVDSFLYGVSLSRIAREVPGAGQLFVMPSGSEPPNYEEILPNPRWHRLAAGFREMSALLVLAAPAGAPHIEKLVGAADGAVLVGEAVPPQVPVARIVGSVREPRPPMLSPIVGIPIVPSPTLGAAAPALPGKSRWSPNRVAVAAGTGVTLTLALAAMTAWLAYRPLAGADRPQRRVVCDSTGQTARPCSTSRANILTVRPVPRDSLADTADVISAPPLPAVVNPQDSSMAAAFGVHLLTANTLAGAIFKLQKDGKNLPAATFGRVDVQGVPWFKVVSGAFVNRADADSLLANLRQRNLLQTGESVVKLPYAFLVDSVPGAAVAGMVAGYADRGLPVYALRQTNGTAWLLVGAYESLQQASLDIVPLRASSIPPVLVYRKGRPF
jgi:hypothetical protein